MSKISAVSFIRNEEETLRRSLDAIKSYVDEIVIFDLESEDHSEEIAREYTDHVYSRPNLLCGDSYKMELREKATGDWLLWFYPDEVWIEGTMEAMRKLISMEKFNSFAFMRHEYMDGVRLQFEKDGKIVAHGTADCPNYQNRLHKKCKEIFYTEFVHAEIHGNNRTCGCPPELYFDHFKTSKTQEFDNIRLYIWYKFLIWKYGNTIIQPYRTYVDSYRKIVYDSEALNRSGVRRTHPAEEEWWDWRKLGFKIPEDTKDRALKIHVEDKNAKVDA